MKGGNRIRGRWASLPGSEDVGSGPVSGPVGTVNKAGSYTEKILEGILGGILEGRVSPSERFFTTAIYG